MLYERAAISRRSEELGQAGAGGFVGEGPHDEAIDHSMMKDLKAVLQGERLRGYPTLEDIEDRTDLYDIPF
jgi:hypothetical protein